MRSLAIVGLFFLLFSSIPQEAAAKVAAPADYVEAVTVSRVVVQVVTSHIPQLLEIPKSACGIDSTFRGPEENFAAWLSQTPCPGFELVQVSTSKTVAYSVVVTDSISNQTVAVQRPVSGQVYTVAVHAASGKGTHTALIHAPDLFFGLRPGVLDSAGTLVLEYSRPKELVFTNLGNIYNLRC